MLIFIGLISLIHFLLFVEDICFQMIYLLIRPPYLFVFRFALDQSPIYLVILNLVISIGLF